MRRVRHNLDILVSRLTKMGYDFLVESNPQDVTPATQYRWGRTPPPETTADLLAELERIVGAVPYSLQAFWEQVGSVSLVGHHPRLNPSAEELFAETQHGDKHEGEEIYADPLQVFGLRTVLEQLQGRARTSVSGGPTEIAIGDNAAAKALEPQGDFCPYVVSLPDLGADTVLREAPQEATFVEYLRVSFAWGGFPGWQQQAKLPKRQIAALTKGLLPI